MSKVKDALCVEYGEFDVSQDRDKYIGGSDLPIICGISKFKTRWQLLLEKAGLAENTFEGNPYTRYGHYIEPFIRDHINLIYNTQFVPNRVINGDIRCHSDGFNGECVLEIKSTSDIFSSVDGYKVYLIQLVKYMEQNEVKKGILAVYDRPGDMSQEFDPKRLQVFEILLDDYKNLLSEQDFLPAGNMVALADKVAKLENQLAALKEVENQCKEAKKALYNEMLNRKVKSWTMPNGTKLTMVMETPAGTKTVTEFDTEAFKAECPGIYQKYLKTVEKKTNGKAGYVRITVPG